MRTLFYATTVSILTLAIGCVADPSADTQGTNETLDITENSDATADASGGQAMTDDSSSTPEAAETNDFATTDSGLKYRIVSAGDGEKPSPESRVRVHYRGWLPDPANPNEGTQFDSSYDRGEPAEFPLNGVIPGWTEGLQLVGEGGKIELEIPPDLGYGARGAGNDIPPNATLRFSVELLEIVALPEPGPVDADAAEELTTTDSGLKYRIRRKGTGSTPTAGDTVTVHYRGWLPDENAPTTGKVFDSSYSRGEPTSFPLSAVVPGWTEGLQLVSEGGMIELEIPPSLGYGAQGAGGVIPPNATLRFLVELLKVH